MASPVPDSYSCASGGAIYGGRSGLPAWVPEAGTFVNIGSSTLLSAAPTGWPNSDIGGPFANWSGGVFASDMGELGSYVIHGSGHLSAGQPLWAGVWCFDLASLTWVGRNVPSVPMLEGDAVNAYFESTEAATLGHTYPPHTYDGVIYQSSSNGGGASGSMLRNFIGGSVATKMVHKFDLSSLTAPPTRVIDDVGGAAWNYPMAALDNARNGYWVTCAIGTAPLQFVSFTDWAVTSYAGVGYNTYGDNSLVYIPSRDCLVGFGRAAGDLSIINVYVCPIVAGVPQGFTLVTQVGTAPNDGRCGGNWSDSLGGIVCYVGNGSYQVHLLTPPSGALTGSWTWTHQTLTGVSGATPSSNGMNNGSWGRFIEAPALGCFIWCDSVSQQTQAWRLS